MLGHVLHLVAGLAFSVLVGHWMTRYLMDGLWSTIMKPLTNSTATHLNPHRQLPEAVGIIERAFYTITWHLGKAQFIGVWLVLKVAGGWNGWAQDVSYPGGKLLGRNIFNLFLIGTAVSLAYGVVGGTLTDALDKGHWFTASATPLALVLGTFALRRFGSRSTPAA